MALLKKIGHLYESVILLPPKSFGVLLSCANWGFCILNLTGVTKLEYEKTGEISLRRHRYRANDLLLLMNSLGEKPETSLVKWNWTIHHEKDLSRISFFNQAYIERE